MPSRVKRVDVHSHVLPLEMVEAIRKRPRDYQMRVEGAAEKELFIRDDRHSTPVYAEFHDADAKVEGMDRKGIDVSVISVTPVVFFYWLDAEAGRTDTRRLPRLRLRRRRGREVARIGCHWIDGKLLAMRTGRRG